MHILLVTGTLGSGKTTLISEIIRRGIIKSEKTLYIVNDAGLVNIDSSRLLTRETVSLTAGCVCCEDIQSLSRALDKGIGRADINTIVIEPSGLAEVSDLYNLIQFKNLPCLHLHLVDYQRGEFEELKTKADIHVLSHCNMAEYEYIKEDCSSKLTHLDSPEFFEEVSTQLLSGFSLAFRAITRGQVYQNHQDHRHSENRTIANMLVRADDLFFLSELKQAATDGLVERAKGNLNSLRVEVVDSRVFVTAESAEVMRSGLFLMIGKPLLIKRFQRYISVFKEFQKESEVKRRLSLLPNLNADLTKHFVVASECDRAIRTAISVLDSKRRIELTTLTVVTLVEWKIRAWSFIDNNPEIGSLVEQVFWKHSLSGFLVWIVQDFGEILSTDLLQTINSLRPVYTYFETMKFLAQQEQLPFIPPFLQEEKPWDFWIKSTALESGEISSDEIISILVGALDSPLTDNAQLETCIAAINSISD